MLIRKDNYYFYEMKKLLLGLALLLATLSVSAIPAKRGQKATLTLADGTQVVAELRGDEYGHYYEAEDGTIFTETAIANVFERADKSTVLKNANARRTARNAKRTERRNGRHKEFGVPTSYTGEKKGIIILVNFTDQSFKAANNKAYFNNIVNTEGFADSRFNGSVHDYFKSQSNGQFDLTFDVVGPVTVSHNCSYYGGNDYWGDDQHPEEMIVEACHLVDDEVDFNDYDWDGDGEVDQVYVIYCGKGEADGGASSTIWPHEWELSETNSDFTLDGVRINTYACGPELNGSGYINGLGTICHEFTHCLGLPDFYDTSSNGNNFGMSNWSLMDYGCYNNNGYTPCNYTGYERMFCGWVNPIVLKQNMAVTGMKSMEDYGDVYIMYNPGHRDEYYIFQNIQQKGWDQYAESKGLMILHVDYDKDTWQADAVNNTSSRQRCTIFAADNSYNRYSLSGDLFPYNSRNSFSNTTTPAAKLYNDNTDGTKLMNIEVTAITQKSDGTIEFNFVNNNEVSDDPVPQGDIFSETFDKCNGTGGNDDRWSGSIASSKFSPDNSGWDVSQAYGANKCARFGTGRKAGIATTPEFPVNGVVTMVFKAAPWNTDGGSIQLSTSNEGISLSQESFELSNEEWTLCTVTLSGVGSTTLTFMASDNRFFLDEINGSQDEVTGISIITPQREAGSRRIYSLDGRYLGTDFDRLARGIYIIGGKKIIK